MRRRRRTARRRAAGTANVGAAVAINVVSAVNEATIGEDAKISAKWLTVEAKRTDVKGDTTGTIGAEAISGASGGKVGIAGSLALNISDSRNEALIKSGAEVTLTGTDEITAARRREGGCRGVDGLDGSGHGEGVSRCA